MLKETTIEFYYIMLYSITIKTKRSRWFPSTANVASNAMLIFFKHWLMEKALYSVSLIYKGAHFCDLEHTLLCVKGRPAQL